jgi:hypothetical protein
MPENVKCADCGYLAVRHFQTRQLLDAEDTFRTNGTIPQVQLDLRTHCWIYDDWPVCFANEISFREASEIGRVSDSETRTRAIHKERNCNSFTPWKQGFTPKEHEEMIQQNALLEWQREEGRLQRVGQEKEGEAADNLHR